MRLTAVIACHGDAPAVPSMHRRLTDTFSELGTDYEIIFVNDGSPDNAREVLAELAGRDPRVTVVNHTRAFGSQSAFTSGMRIATGDAVVLLDGDLQDPPELIAAFVEKWREGYEVVYGERVNRVASRAMRSAYKLFYRCFRRMAYVPLPLDAGDFGLLDRRVVDAINALPEKHRFIRGLRAWVGYRQIGVPYVRPEREFGRSTNSLLKNLGWARRAVLSLSYKPLDFIGWLALVTVGLSMVAMVVQVALRIAFPGAAPRGFTTLLLVILFIGGVQFLCLSIIGSYLAHIYEEVKGRPAYVVDDIINPPRHRAALGNGARTSSRPSPAVPPGSPPASAPAAAAVAPAAAVMPAPHQPVTVPSRRVLVTGAGGFVGANLVRRLVTDGHRVTALTRPGGRPWRLEGMADSVETVEVDLRDEEAVNAAVGRVRPQWTFHLAAFGCYSWQDDARRIHATNVLGTVSLVEACRRVDSEAFVHAGSSSEYGFKDHAPAEDEALEPNSHYAVAKAAATTLCRYAAYHEGFPAVTLRLYSVYGPWEEPGRLVPNLVARGMRNELPPLVHPETAHDFVAIDDVVDAFLLAAQRAPHRAGAIYNVGSGEQTTLAELVDIARRELSVEAEPQWGSAAPRTWDTASWVADTSRIRTDLGWTPGLGLAEGFRRTAAWLQSTPSVWHRYDVRAGSPRGTGDGRTSVP